MPKPTQIFQDRESGIAIKVDAVGERFATITIMAGTGSRWQMPLTQYDGQRDKLPDYTRTFVEQYRPIDTGSLHIDERFRMPANASVWDDEDAATAEQVAAVAADVTVVTDAITAAATPDPEPDGVRIGEETPA